MLTRRQASVTLALGAGSFFGGWGKLSCPLWDVEQHLWS